MQLHLLNSLVHFCAAMRIITAMVSGAISTKQSLTQHLQGAEIHNGEK
jgi:hypothetical protein